MTAIVDPLVMTVVYLVAMVATVPLARKLGLGSVLGYLIAGVVLGRSSLGLLGHEQEGVLHFAEFGVIMMLFLIGLELRPSVLWKMRGPIFGLGGLQVSLTAAAILGLGLLTGADWKPSLAVGLILALSSTAIVVQTLQEKGALKTTGGETAFSVLLFQDVAVILIIALFPFLGANANASAVSNGSAWIKAAQVLGAVSLVVVTGRYLIQPVFRMLGRSRLRELFTAMALLLVLSITLLMNAVGLSPALGAFLAGVVLAESDYRHQLETDIEPFKGLLMGVFFISVGAGIDFSRIAEMPGFVAGVVLTIVAVKWALLYLVGRMGKLSMPDRLLFAFSLAQGGEFAFVLLNFAMQEKIVAPPIAQALTASVPLSMFCAPAMITLYLSKIQPRFSGCEPERPADEIDEASRENPVIVAGFGRFGQMVARLLRTTGINATVLDYDADQVELLRNFGTRVYYGDAGNMDLLRSAGANRARLLIIAIDDKNRALEIIDGVKKEFPHLKILARAYDRLHAYDMIAKGIEHPYIETAGSALQLGIAALRELGMPAHQAVRTAQIFNRHNDDSIQHLAKVYNELDEESYLAQARDWITALEGVLKEDTSFVTFDAARGWEAAPREDASSAGA
jgi:monovalent cation:proton antiporter-2 (CPA2) family protein